MAKTTKRGASKAPKAPKAPPSSSKPAVLGPLFRSNLQRTRERLELTQGNLAARAGYSISYLSMLERGTRDPTLATIEHVSRALGFEHPRDMFRGKAA